MKSHIHVFVALLCAAAHCQGQGTLITAHFGAADPIAEGFNSLIEGNPSLTPVTGDLGMDAWSIHLSAASDQGSYFRNLTAQEQAALEPGWILSLSVRILEPFDSPSFGIHASLNTGTAFFALLLGAESNGDPIVQVGNLSYKLSGGGVGYHNYQLRYASATGLASLWIDGTERLTDLTGASSLNSPQFFWGGGQHYVLSTYANWNEASLSAIPEPSAVSLILGAVGAFACFRQRVGPHSKKRRWL